MAVVSHFLTVGHYWVVNCMAVTVCCVLMMLTVQNAFLTGLQRHLRSISSLTPVSPQPSSGRDSLSRLVSSQPFLPEYQFFRMVDMFVKQVLLWWHCLSSLVKSLWNASCHKEQLHIVYWFGLLLPHMLCRSDIGFCSVFIACTYRLEEFYPKRIHVFPQEIGNPT